MILNCRYYYQIHDEISAGHALLVIIYLFSVTKSTSNKVFKNSKKIKASSHSLAKEFVNE